jgi:hypothetical protein
MVCVLWGNEEAKEVVRGIAFIIIIIISSSSSSSSNSSINEIVLLLSFPGCGCSCFRWLITYVNEVSATQKKKTVFRPL